MSQPASPRWWRLLCNRRFDERAALRALGPGALDRLAQRVADSEKTHSGEIRLSIEGGLPLSYLWRRASARERAIALFGKLRVWDTEGNNGVLIYLLLAERAIEIVADRALARQVPQSQWQALADGMSARFQAGEFEAGLTEAVDAVGDLLRTYFAASATPRVGNELPDRPDLR
jgi:hypothetical protein